MISERMRELLATLTTELDTFDSQIRSGNNRLRCAKLEWGTVAQTAASMKWLLGYHCLLQSLRETAQSATKAAAAVHQRIYRSDSPQVNIRASRSSSGWGNRSTGEYARDIKALRFAGDSLPNPDDEQAARAALNRHRKLLADADETYRQFTTVNNLPYYIGEAKNTLPIEGKKHGLKFTMPRGGRVAYSVLLACAEGSTDNNQQTEHKLFGWHCSGSKIIANLHRIIRTIDGRSLERNGKAPSLSVGQSELRQWVKPPPSVRTHEDRRRALRSSYGQQIFDAGLGNSDRFSPYMIRVLTRDLHECTIRQKVAHKIMGKDRGQSDVHVATVLTGPIERIGETDCYRAPCLASNNGDNCKEGIVLFRAKWPDCLHLTPDCKPSQRDPAEAHAAYAIGIDVYLAYRATDASEYYFERMEQQRLRDIERNRTQAEREAIRRADLAKQIRTLRSLPVIAVTDSTSRGNCYAGTIQWAAQIGLAPDERTSAPGKLIARKWAKAQYPQPDRLGNVLRMAGGE